MKVKIEDLCIYTTSGATPTSTNYSYYNPPSIPWLRTKEVNFNYIYDTEIYISEEGLRNSSTKLIPVNSVIVAMYGQGDTAGRVAINKIPLCTNQACCNLIIDPEKADYKFVFYALSNQYDELVQRKNGGAQPNLNSKLVKTLEIPLFSLEKQHRVANTLNAYDSLIENNRKQIKLLEESAQRLYKEWFIDFHFPGYESTPIDPETDLPEGWKRVPLGSYVEFKRGKIITEKQAEKGSIPVVAGGLNPAYYHSVSNTKAPVITISGSGANAGFTRLYTQDIWASDCSYVDSSGCSTPLFVYESVVVLGNGFKHLQRGSAQPHVYPKHINELEITLPAPACIYEFERIATSLFQRVNLLTMQIDEATEARNRLLPKLISGAIEV